MFRRTKKIIASRMGRRASGCWSLPQNRFRILLSLILKWEGNTYTAQTLALLKEAYPDIEVYFIIGADSLYQLESWYHPEQVMAQAVLLVSGRTYEDGGVPLEDKVAYFNEKYNADIRILHNPKIDVASADIRKKAAEGRDLSKDMPAAVAEYIRETGLYLPK